jgi:hypothetical protein
MWLRVDLVCTDVSGERITSIFRIQESSSSFPPPDNDPIPILVHSLLPAHLSLQTLPLSSLLISHVAHSPSLPALTYSRVISTGGSVCSHLLTPVPLSWIFYPEDGGDTFNLNECFNEIFSLWTVNMFDLIEGLTRIRVYIFSPSFFFNMP